MLSSQVTTALHMNCEKAYDTIASLLKIPFLDEEVANNSFPCKKGRVDGFNQQSVRKDVAYTRTNVHEQNTGSASALERPANEDQTGVSLGKHEGADSKKLVSCECKFRPFICGEEAMRISPHRIRLLTPPHLQRSLDYFTTLPYATDPGRPPCNLGLDFCLRDCRRSPFPIPSHIAAESGGGECMQPPH